MNELRQLFTDLRAVDRFVPSIADAKRAQVFPGLLTLCEDAVAALEAAPHHPACIRLEKEVIRQEERFIACVSHLEGPYYLNAEHPGCYISLLKVFPNGDSIRMFKRVEPIELKEGESEAYPPREWREWMKDRPKWPNIPFRNYAEYRAAINPATSQPI